MIHLIKLWPRHRLSCGVWQQRAGMLWGLYASNGHRRTGSVIYHFLWVFAWQYLRRRSFCVTEFNNLTIQTLIFVTTQASFSFDNFWVWNWNKTSKTSTLRHSTKRKSQKDYDEKKRKKLSVWSRLVVWPLTWALLQVGPDGQTGTVGSGWHWLWYMFSWNQREGSWGF